MVAEMPNKPASCLRHQERKVENNIRKVQLIKLVILGRYNITKKLIIHNYDKCYGWV